MHKMLNNLRILLIYYNTSKYFLIHVTYEKNTLLNSHCFKL